MKLNRRKQSQQRGKLRFFAVFGGIINEGPPACCRRPLFNPEGIGAFSPHISHSPQMSDTLQGRATLQRSLPPYGEGSAGASPYRHYELIIRVSPGLARFRECLP